MVETKEVAFPIGFAFDLQVGPDGKQWPTMTVAANFAQFTVQIPVDVAEQMVNSLPAALKEVIGLANRTNGDSLIVAPANSMELLKGTQHGHQG